MNIEVSHVHRHRPHPRLDNSRGVQNLIVDGKLLLALEDAIAPALESNLDIPVVRCNLPIAQTDLLHAKRGARHVVSQAPAF